MSPLPPTARLLNPALRHLNIPKPIRFSLDDMHPVKGWPTYLLGMIYMIMPEKRLPYGMDVVIAGDVPVGAGMSSSAALCSAFGLALNEIFQIGIIEDGNCTGRAKNRTAVCGTSMRHHGSVRQSAWKSRSSDETGLPQPGISNIFLLIFLNLRIILVNTMVSHSLASSEYNLRRQQCEAGVALLQKYDPSIRSLRDVSGQLLQTHRNEMDEPWFIKDAGLL